MAASLIIEEESGTYTPRFHRRHNGYYAGDFSRTSRSGATPSGGLPAGDGATGSAAIPAN